MRALWGETPKPSPNRATRLSRPDIVRRLDLGPRPGTVRPGDLGAGAQLSLRAAFLQAAFVTGTPDAGPAGSGTHPGGMDIDMEPGVAARTGKPGSSRLQYGKAEGHPFQKEAVGRM
jgi:hypothetical protein